MSRIQLESVSKKFGTTHAIHDVSLDIADGEFMVLLGPSGCGKSTLLRMVAGLTQPTYGRIIFDDNDITTAPPRQRDLAMVFQSYALYPHLTVAKNIGFPLRSRKQSRRTIADSVAKVASILDLTALLDRRPGDLSGGQRQRVALARAMVREPGAAAPHRERVRTLRAELGPRATDEGQRQSGTASFPRTAIACLTQLSDH